MKKEGQKSLTGLRRQKPCKKFEGEQQKIALNLWPIEEREKEVLKNFELKFTQ